MKKKENLENTKIYISKNSKDENFMEYTLTYIKNGYLDLYLNENKEILCINEDGNLSPVKIKDNEIVALNINKKFKKYKKLLLFDEYKKFYEKQIIFEKNFFKNKRYNNNYSVKNPGLLEGPILRKGKIVCLPIILKFKEDNKENEFKNNCILVHDFINEKLKNYFLEMSSNKLEISSIEPVIIELEYSYKYFCYSTKNYIPDFIESSLKKISIEEIEKLTLNENGGIGSIIIIHFHEKIYQNYANPKLDVCQLSVKRENKKEYFSYYYFIQSFFFNLK